MANSPTPQDVTVRLKLDRRLSDAERIAALEQARQDFVEALTLYTRAKARLKELIARSGDDQ